MNIVENDSSGSESLDDFEHYVKAKHESPLKATGGFLRPGRCNSADSPSPTKVQREQEEEESEKNDLMPSSPLKSPTKYLQVQKKKSSSSENKWWDYKKARANKFARFRS